MMWNTFNHYFLGILTGSIHSSDDEIKGFEKDYLKEIYGKWAVSGERTVFMDHHLMETLSASLY